MTTITLTAGKVVSLFLLGRAGKAELRQVFANWNFTVPDSDFIQTAADLLDQTDITFKRFPFLIGKGKTAPMNRLLPCRQAASKRR